MILYGFTKKTLSLRGKSFLHKETNCFMDERIKELWFERGRIYILTDAGKQYSQPLEAFPELFYATNAQRENYYVWDDGKSIRWEGIDEDIHISNFFEQETVNYDNEVNHLLSRFPYIDMKKFAEYLGMHWTKLARFRYGIWVPSSEVLEKIRNGIKAIGKEMVATA